MGDGTSGQALGCSAKLPLPLPPPPLSAVLPGPGRLSPAWHSPNVWLFSPAPLGACLQDSRPER